MNDANGNARLIEKIAEGIWFKFVSRSAMIFATLCLPVGGYFGKRIIDSNDRALDQLAQTITSVKLLQQQVEDQRIVRDIQFGDLKVILEDHEGRIRLLERVPRL